MPVTSWGWHFVAMFVPHFLISQAQVFRGAGFRMPEYDFRSVLAGLG